MSDFDFDPAAARSADNTGRISENGGYKGEIIAAWKDFSTKGSQSFNIKFRTDEGQNVNLVFWVKNKDGEKLSGEKLVHKIMACVGVRPLNSRPGVVSIYSYQDKQEVKHDKEVYPDLAGKKIGLFLERENELYTSNGQDKEGFKMQVFAPFRYEDHKMAAEIMDKAPKATQYEKVLAWITNKKPRVNDRRDQRGNEYPDSSGVYGGRHSDASFGDPDDSDIPFAPIARRSYL